MNPLFNPLIETLKHKNPKNLNMVIGFDGFVDEIIQVVDKRQDSHTFTRIKTIGQLAKRIENASGLSTNIELVSTVRKIGGNGPIMCNALAQHEPKITYIGALGYPHIHDVFHEMTEHARLITMADSGHTDALEFLDGKLMLGKMTSLSDVNYTRLLDVLPENELVKLIQEADLFATVNWSMLPQMTDLWKNILTRILPQIPTRKNKPTFFVDLADPEKREHHEIKEALHLLVSFKPHFRVVLGLNKKEAYDIASLYHLFAFDDLKAMTVSLENVNRALAETLNLDGIVIHPVDRSSVFMNDTYVEHLGPLCENPKLTTGAGDNFNSGFVLGLLLDLDPGSSLLMGMATSGFYVRHARSPKWNELLAFLERWSNGKHDEAA